MARDPVVCGVPVRRGEKRQLYIETAKLYDFTEQRLPLVAVRGEKDGPGLFVCAAIHGDEINGVESIRRLLNAPALKDLRGLLLAAPVVNVFGFNAKSRYLPDRRDLNRCFPGSPDGSLASRIADSFMYEVVRHCRYGIDLHTGSLHRTNLPQVRANLKDRETLRLAKAFGAPIAVNAVERDGSLREAARARRVRMLVYEGGEALRFDRPAIRAGVRGCLSVMRSVGMLPPRAPAAGGPAKTHIARGSSWIRAPHSGTLRFLKRLGDRVDVGERVAWVADLLGAHRMEVVSPWRGVVIGLSRVPLANRGDALAHVAHFEKPPKARSIYEHLDIEL